jgi:hypothetical protein
MKLYLPNLSCGKCNQSLANVGNHLVVEIADQNHYEAKCSAGHVSAISLQGFKFEILFEMGAVALIEGYHREAVANFAGSIERFGEFYIELMSLMAGNDVDEFQECWKLLSRQSERQLGALAFAYFQKNNRALKYLPSKMIEFRNDVIHKGYIPTFAEASKYGQSVLSFIDPIFEQLKEAILSIHELNRRHYSKFKILTNTIVLETIITSGHSHYFSGPRDFLEQIERLRERMNDSEKAFYGVRGR